MYSPFGLVLMVNHDCNCRCNYCYGGRKFSHPMPLAVARKARERAFQSLASGGKLELGFFGGEPLLEAALIRQFLTESRALARQAGFDIAADLTTNGTVTGSDADALLLDPAIELSVSLDGLPEVHDRHRMSSDGRPTAAAVLQLCHRLLDAGRELHVVMTVGPDAAAALPGGLRFLRDLGVRMVEANLDVWAAWKADEIARLEEAIAAGVEVWREGLPSFGVNWYNEKLAERAGLPVGATARCGFGRGEIAVAPSGQLYPCERLIGEDCPDNPMCLPGDVFSGDDFLNMAALDVSGSEPCGLSCPCCNYLRTGSAAQPDELLRRMDAACTRAVDSVLDWDGPGRLRLHRARREEETNVHV